MTKLILVVRLHSASPPLQSAGILHTIALDYSCKLYRKLSGLGSAAVSVPVAACLPPLFWVCIASAPRCYPLAAGTGGLCAPGG